MKKQIILLSCLLSAGLAACTCFSPKRCNDAKYTAWAKQAAEEKKPGDLKSVSAYGKFQHYSYFSKTAGRETNVNVLLPPGYSEKEKYPVLYILHGYYDDENWMARDIVGIPQMLTKLYESGEAKKMIVVLPYIFTSKELKRCTGMNLQNSLAYDNFINDLTTDLMPFIEKTFSVKKGRDNTAVTGFSMGGRESLFIGFKRPDLFSYIGAVCPAPGLVPLENSAAHPGQMQKSEIKFADKDKPRLLLISAAKNDGAVRNTPSDYHNMLNANSIDHVWKLMDGTGHDQSSVTPHLFLFFSLVFQ